jgi:hypothetical protein
VTAPLVAGITLLACRHAGDDSTSAAGGERFALTIPNGDVVPARRNRRLHSAVFVQCCPGGASMKVARRVSAACAELRQAAAMASMDLLAGILGMAIL